MTAKYPHGSFTWVDLQTSDLDGAKAFYGELLGWEFFEMPMPDGGVYVMPSKDGKTVGGIGEIPADMSDTPPHWNSHVSVDDVDVTTARAAEHGGTVIQPPFDVLDAGRMSIVQDPTGAYIVLWEAKENPGAMTFNVPGALSWNELLTNNTAAAEAFYTALFGWTTETDDNSYTMWLNNGRPNGGMMAISEEMGEMPSHWGIYLGVEDIDVAVEKSKELGGAVYNGPFDIGDPGKIAIIADPQGATFTAIQLRNADEPLQLS